MTWGSSSDRRARALIERVEADHAAPLEDHAGEEIQLAGGLSPYSDRDARGPAALAKKYGRRR